MATYRIYSLMVEKGRIIYRPGSREDGTHLDLGVYLRLQRMRMAAGKSAGNIMVWHEGLGWRVLYGRD